MVTHYAEFVCLIEKAMINNNNRRFQLLFVIKTFTFLTPSIGNLMA